MSKHNVMPNDAMDLVSATSLGAYSTVEDILRNNLEDVNKVNSSGWTPVMYAANYGHFNVIRLLIRYGCNVDYRDWQGRTALMLAASNGHTRCLDVLINYGKADKKLKDLSGTDAYKYAKNCGHGNNKLIKTLLMKSEGHELRGRQFNAPTPAPSPVVNSRKSFPISPKKPLKDDIYNPCQKTPFSNSLTDFWRSTDVKLDERRDPQHYAIKRSTENLVSTLGTSPQESQNYSSDEIEVLSSSQSSAHSSLHSSLHSSIHSTIHSSVISAPKIHRKCVGIRKKAGAEQIDDPMPATLFHFLSRIDLIQYLDLFEGNGIDFYTFLTLTDSDLQKLGITSFGHRKRLSIAQCRYHEALDINKTQESVLADYLLSERQELEFKVKELEEKLKELETKN